MNTAVTTLPRASLVASMAAKYDMEPQAFIGAVKATCIKGECSNEQFAAFLMVAKEYGLNPLLKEVYAFPDRGGVQPIVSIDGWMNLINGHPQFDGMEFTDIADEGGRLTAVECRMYRKDRTRHTSVIEYMGECARQTEPWKKWPNRMLRHKAAIQCARYAFGFSGIMEPDEFERMTDITPASPGLAARLAKPVDGPREGFTGSITIPPAPPPSAPADEPAGTALEAGSGVTEAPLGDATHSAPTSSPVADQATAEPSQAAVADLSDEAMHALFVATRQMIGASRAGGDWDADVRPVLNGIGAELASAHGDVAKARILAVVKHIKAAVGGELEWTDALAMIAGLVGVEEHELEIAQ